MKKRLLKVAITTALTVAFAVPAFANPFADVPANHWAYAAVNNLVKAGVVDGYSDGTFKGDKTVTRYEMAQIVAKAMTKGLNAEQQAAVDQLSKEFATELNTLGVKVDGIQKQLDNSVKISGDARVRYFHNEGDRDNTDYRARVTFDGKINDNMKFNARLAGSGNANEGAGASIVLDTANVTAKLLGTDTTVGRQDLKLGSGFLFDDKVTGIASQVGDLKLFAGNAKANVDASFDSIYGAEYKMNILGANTTLDYLKDENKAFYGANTSFGLIDGVTANAEYIKNYTDNAKAYAYGVKLNNYGLSATYRDIDANAYNTFSGLNNTQLPVADVANGVKGMEFQYDKALDKNATLTVKYQDFENKVDGAKIGATTSAAVNVKFSYKIH